MVPLPLTLGRNPDPHAQASYPVSKWFQSACCPPRAHAAFKITVSVNRAPPLLTSLFEDLIASLPPGMEQATAGPMGARMPASSPTPSLLD